MSDKKQPDAEQHEKQSKQHKVCLWIKRWWFSGTILVGLALAFLIICLPYLSPERRATNNDHTRLGWYLIGLAVTGGVVLCIPRVITSNPKKYFITRVLTTGITGGAFALLLPIAVKSTTTGVGGLRHSILLATGGLLAILTLGETRRKNDIDKRKNDQEKDKNDKDHRRQVRAGRRERYTKAVEQLGDEKAPVRMGGVYTLVGLVDEWLKDESIKKYEDRLKEGQVIINNLCAYIRSPFTLASHYDELSKPSPTPKGIYKGKKEKFYADKATLDSEADVRLSIIKEIHGHLQGSGKNTPGAWSDFEYDFSGSAFFYPVDLTKSYYKNPAIFNNSHYHKKVDFSGSIYNSQVSFRGSIYKKKVTFSSFKSRSTYKGEANFSKSIYLGLAEFGGSIYEKDVIFSTSGFTPTDWDEDDLNGSTYKGKANFSNSIYKGLANFSDSTYEKEVIFSAPFARSTYKGEADFRSSTYQDKAVFSGSIYQVLTYFSGSIFYSETYFSKGGYSNSPSCFTNCAPQFYDKKNRKNTLFGSHNNDFTVDIDKGYPIDLDSKSIPLNCKFLTSEQKEYLEGKLQEIEKIQNKLLEAKDPKEKVEISKKLRSFTEKLHEWREEATTVKVEDVAAEDTES